MLRRVLFRCLRAMLLRYDAAIATIRETCLRYYNTPLAIIARFC